MLTVEHLHALQERGRRVATPGEIRRAEQLADEEPSCASCEGAGFVRVDIGASVPQPMVCRDCLTPEQIGTIIGIPPRYRSASFDTFRPVEGKADALTAAREWDFTGGIVLVGENGVGKTHLAAAMLRAATERAYPARFHEIAELLQQVRARMKDDQAQPYLDHTLRTHVLAIDDLGKERLTDWVAETVWTIINRRYSAALPTVVTTNLTFGDIESRYGRAVADRLRDWRWVQVGGKSMRG